MKNEHCSGQARLNRHESKKVRTPKVLVKKRYSIDTLTANAVRGKITRQEYIPELLKQLQSIRLDVLFERSDQNRQEQHKTVRTGTVMGNMQEWGDIPVEDDDDQNRGVVWMGFIMCYIAEQVREKGCMK